MRPDSLNERFEKANRPVYLRVQMTLETSLLLDAIAKQRGQSIEQAVAEAISEWRTRRERFINRQTRLKVERALREAKDVRPAQEIIDGFAAQMQRAGKSWDTPLTVSAPSDINTAMTEGTGTKSLRERREALGLSREALARMAGISAPAIAQFENGIRPKESRALPILEATLAEQESVAA